MVPNLSFVPVQVFADGGYNLETVEGCGKFCEAVVTRLHALDANFGHLKKIPPQNNYNGHAVDATLYRPNGQTVDFVIASGEPGAKVGWSVKEDDHYPVDKWYAPSDDAPNQPSQPPAASSASFEQNVNAAIGRVEQALGTVRVVDNVGEAVPTAETLLILRTGWLLSKDDQILKVVADLSKQVKTLNDKLDAAIKQLPGLVNASGGSGGLLDVLLGNQKK